MFTRIGDERRSFPELVGHNAQQAAQYVSAQGNGCHLTSPVSESSALRYLSGFNPVILRANDPTTRDLRMDRVRIIVDPTRTVVIKPPMVG